MKYVRTGGVFLTILTLMSLFVPSMPYGAADAAAQSRTGSVAQVAAGETVKVAAIHFAPVEGDVARNRATMVDLATQAARNDARIIVLPEMATSGYSFFSRAEISQVAETVPGPSTEAMAAIADTYDAYIAFGMPQYEPETNLYYNAVVLLDPEGDVRGVYKKRNHLLESAYNAQVFAPLPTFDTEYGRLAIVICSDLFYSQYPRAAAVQGATMLLAPANVGVEAEVLQVRAYENDMAVVVANRYGEGTAGTKPEAFTEDTFTIPSPYPYDFNFGSRSTIVKHTGEVVADHSEHTDAVVYGDVPVRTQRTLPVVRKPGMYSLLAQDTLEPYTQTQFRQPPARTFATAAVDPGPSETPWADALTAAQNASADANDAGMDLRLIVYPADFFTSQDEEGFADLKRFAVEEGIDLLIHHAGNDDEAPRSVLIASNGATHSYERTHRARSESISPEQLSNDYWVVDRDYARVALMHDIDMVPPETAHVMSRMGVDVVAVNAKSSHDLMSALWRSRTADYLHIAVANRSAPEGIYLGGYQSDPSFREAEGQVIMEMNTAHIREKPSSRFFHYESLLQPCDATARNC